MHCHRRQREPKSCLHLGYLDPGGMLLERRVSGRTTDWTEAQINTNHISKVKGWLLEWDLDICLACGTGNYPQPSQTSRKLMRAIEGLLIGQGLDIAEPLPSASLGNIKLWNHHLLQLFLALWNLAGFLQNDNNKNNIYWILNIQFTMFQVLF